MNLNLLLQRSVKAMLSAVLVLMLITAFSNQATAQRPSIPILSLTGADMSWDDTWYPDGRIWIPPNQTQGAPREFLVPVFVNNKWFTYFATRNLFKAKPIYSFQFRLQYDSSAIRAVGVQTFGPKDAKIGNDPLAKNFRLSWYDFRDTTYKIYLNPQVQLQDRQRGRSIRIVGTSDIPLPNTDTNGTDFKVLLYVRFQVIPKEGNVGISSNTPIIIANDTIKWNDLNVRLHAPFEELRNYDPSVGSLYPDPDKFTGLAGVNNSTLGNIWQLEPTLPGTIYLMISDNIPTFTFNLQRGKGQPGNQLIQDQNFPELWNMIDPITVDINAPEQPPPSRRIFDVLNGVSSTRLLDIKIETDQPWLLFHTIPPGQTPCASPTRSCNINWIDNGILGANNRHDPKDQETKDDGDVHIEVICDPTLLNIDSQNPEDKAGVYVGYITFESSTAVISPSRIRVTFVYFLTPEESNTQANTTGINLLIYKSSPKSPTGDYKRLVFGTGSRATNGIDPIYGELAAITPMTGFDARFFPPPGSPDSLNAAIPNGFGELAPSDETPRTNSRDVRGLGDNASSIIYYVKMTVDSVSDYPITVEWDAADFPPDAQLYIKDASGSNLFPSVNMRSATPKGGTKFSWTITDPRITSFLIEYTKPNVYKWVDSDGNPIIKKGWNLLSLPVNPLNKNWTVVFPNAINIPKLFTQNQFQDKEILQPGYGYYVKYGNKIDSQFVGTPFYLIDENTFPVRIWPGWNTIGTVTIPINKTKIQFHPFSNQPLPSQSAMLQNGVWGYKTNQGYYEVSTLDPGLGYWIKSDNDGYLFIDARAPKTVDDNLYVETTRDDILNASSKLTIRDNAQHESSLYLANNKNIDLGMFEMPPTPPAGCYDARFKTGTVLENSNKSVVVLTGIEYPLSLTINNADANYTLVDAITGAKLGTIEKGTSNNVEIASTTGDAIKVLREETAEVAGFEFGAYPNPMTAAGTINYVVPEDSYVSIKLYDAIGNEVAVFVDANMTKGSYSYTANVAALSNGSYICKIVAGSYSAVRTITVIK